MRVKFSYSNLTIAVILLIMTIVTSNLNWSKDHWQSIIEVDGKGYYAYLPAVFIYDDLNFGFFDKIEKEKYYNKNYYYDYRYTINGSVVNQYYCGTAIAELPFFFMGHLSSYFLDLETDGYSILYPIFISIAGLFYLLIGLLYLNSLLNFYDINEFGKSLTLFSAVFGTNLFYYTVGEPGMSHIYSFAFISMFLYYLKLYFIDFKKKYILVIACLLGMIVLIRPINGLVLFTVFFLAGNSASFELGLKNAFRHKIWLASGVLAFVALIFIQLTIYKISTGQFLVYSYGEHGFNFLSPKMYAILFSYKKGLFLYTPLYLLSLAGGYYLWKNSKYEFYSWFGFFLLITYFLSSWSFWYYGGSFSSRVYVEFIPLFMILLAILINKVKSKLWSRFYILMIVLLIMVCQIQTFQYRYSHIHWSEMTKEKYWDVFLRVDKLIKKDGD